MSRPEWTATPRWYLWDGGFALLSASEGVVPVHSHHAIQIVIAMEGEAGISTTGDDWQSARGIIVPPDVPHTFSAQGAFGAMLMVDPESTEGAWLRSTIGERITIVPDGRVAPVAAALRSFCETPLQSMEIGALVRFAVESFSAGVAPARHPDPRMTKVLDMIASSSDLRISLEQAAAMVFLSPSRFQHLFKEQVGLPFRRYMLWRKITRAMIAIARERTLSAAAQTSDFADAAHLTRTFHQMFGLPPSLLMQGELFVIKPPFNVAAERL
jgi:AraC family transcriptional regulator